VPVVDKVHPLINEPFNIIPWSEMYGQPLRRNSTDNPRNRAGYKDGLAGLPAEFTEREDPQYFIGHCAGRADYQKLLKVRERMRREERMESGYDDAYRCLPPQAADEFYLHGYDDYYRRYPYALLNPIRALWMIAVWILKRRTGF
jgi:hypothetical protein